MAEMHELVGANLIPCVARPQSPGCPQVPARVRWPDLAPFPFSPSEGWPVGSGGLFCPCALQARPSSSGHRPVYVAHLQIIPSAVCRASGDPGGRGREKGFASHPMTGAEAGPHAPSFPGSTSFQGPPEEHSSQVLCQVHVSRQKAHWSHRRASEQGDCPLTEPVSTHLQLPTGCVLARATLSEQKSARSPPVCSSPAEISNNPGPMECKGYLGSMRILCQCETWGRRNK